MKLLFWKKREYPIKRDESGRSLRSQAFDLFNREYRPSQIYKHQLVAASPKTLYRYYEDWKKKKGKLRYRVLREIMKRNPDIKQQIITAISEQLEMPEEEVIWRMRRPWGLLQYLRGQWPDQGLQKAQTAAEERLETALWFVQFIKQFRNDPEQISDLLVELSMMNENKKLTVTKEDGKLIIKIEDKKEGEDTKATKTIELPAFKEKIEGLKTRETEGITTVSNRQKVKGLKAI